MNQQIPVPRVAAVHDLSGFGKSSLTVVIPILSSMGIQVCPVPTALLSTHTGDFTDYTYFDFTDHLKAYLNHWKQLKLQFQGLYSGFLGSPAQVDIFRGFIQDFKTPGQLVLVDPVMGDDGKTYGPFDQEMILQMRRMIQECQIITPNLTEAAFLLGEEYCEQVSETQIKTWAKRLADMGPESVVITSVPLYPDQGKTSVVAYERGPDRYWKVDSHFVPASYPGTGDAFASVLLGALLQGDSLPLAIDRAVQFVVLAVRASFGYDFPKREGILIEKVLGQLNAPQSISTYEIF